MILAENDDKEEESSRKWSDRGLMDKYGKITAIGIEERRVGGREELIPVSPTTQKGFIPPSGGWEGGRKCWIVKVFL